MYYYIVPRKKQKRFEDEYRTNLVDNGLPLVFELVEHFIVSI